MDKLKFKAIEFVSAQDPYAYPVSPEGPSHPGAGRPSHSSQHGGITAWPKGKAKPGGVKELFREQDIVMNWSKMRRVGAGLQNLGNTCFMNSVLQCLMHTPPLAELLLAERPITGGPRSDGFDPVKMTRDLLQESLRSRHGFVAPASHARTLRKICRSFRHGRQEDAHEYLIALLDAMHERSLAGVVPRPPPAVEFTSFIYRIFGGRIRSQVKCTQCSYESNTYDPFLDLSLEISHAGSVEQALQRYTAAEVLDGSNKYKCPRQNRGVRAEKRMTVEAVPPVLIIQLKRFEFSLSGRKVSKPVSFSDVLDLTSAMSHRPPAPVLYDLYGVLVHHGHSMHSGHYFCFVKGAGGEWHKCDDQRVSTVALRIVLGQSPYMLFYTRRQPGMPAPLPPAQGRNAFGPVQQAASSPPAATEPREIRQKHKQQVASLANGIASVAAGSNRPRNADLPPPARKAAARELAAAAERAAAAEQQHRWRRRRQQQQEEAELAAAVAAAAVDADVEAAALQSGGRAAKRAKRSAEALPLAVLPRPRRGAAVVQSPASQLLSMGRRGKRLEEQLRLGQMSRRAMGTASPVGKRRRTSPVAAPDGRPSLDAMAAREPPVTRRRVASFIDGMANGNSSSIDSAIFAPEWPPLKQPRSAAHEAEATPSRLKHTLGKDAQREAAAAAPLAAAPAHKVNAEAVAAYLRSKPGVTLGVDTWDSADVDSKRHHARLMRRDGVQRRPLDEYDAEYDQGKLKKVRTKRCGGEGLDSQAFDAAFSAKQAAARPGGGGKRQRQKQRL